MVQLNNINTPANTVQTAKAPAAAAADQVNISTDSVRKEIQGKIMNAQKKSQELSLNTEMTAQERENRRQQIQQEISDLKRELRLREEEEKKKQQEAEKAAAQKEERQKDASRKAITEQEENAKVSQGTDNRQQDNIPKVNGSKSADDASADGEVREILPKELHKAVSNDSNIRQYRVIQNVSAQFNRTASIQESEISQDAARGADVTELKEAQRKELQKETQRMEMMQSFIFGNKNNRAAESAIGTRSHIISQDFKENGIYNNNGTLFRNNFESAQMDITLSGI